MTTGSLDLHWKAAIVGLAQWQPVSVLINPLIGTWEIKMLRTVQTMKAWCVRFQRKAKTLLEHLCEDSKESVVKPLCYWGTWCWSAGAKKLVTVKKGPASLKGKFWEVFLQSQYTEAVFQRQPRLHLLLANELCSIRVTQVVLIWWYKGILAKDPGYKE